MTTMYRAVIFFVFLYTASAISEDLWRKCVGVHHVIMHCCYGITSLDITQRNEIRECFEMTKPGPPPPNPCEIESCIGQKFGYYGDNGLDKQAFASFIANIFEKNKDLVAAVNENCLNGDISKYGPSDMCDVVKMQHCFDYQMYQTCPEWNNEGECKGFQEEVSKCFSDY